MAMSANRSSEPEAVTTQPLVAIVDDDESVRESLPDLLRELGFPSRAFASADEFLSSKDMLRTQCLLLDVCMPGMSGPELQQELVSRGVQVPIVFITARADESVRERLMQRGAAACLFKPFSELQLRTALDAALLQMRDSR
jgi:FixJ family two-component response regulator